MHSIVWQTEISLFGRLNAKVSQIPMYMDLKSSPSRASSTHPVSKASAHPVLTSPASTHSASAHPAPTHPATSRLQLKEVVTQKDWQTLENLRSEIEIPFGITEPGEIRKIIIEMQTLTSVHNATWYLASFENELVGEIGLVTFETEIGKVGRLLDVDIAPRHQGKGLGNELLIKIIEVARVQGIEFLCLKADSHRWVKDWYLKLGFQSLGLWQLPTHGPGQELVIAPAQSD